MSARGSAANALPDLESGGGLRGDAARALLEPDFAAMPLAAIADAAISAARGMGAAHVDVRIARQRGRAIWLRDTRPMGSHADASTAIGVRVIVDGSLGFASTDDVSPSSAADAARAAVSIARVSASAVRSGIQLADEPIHADEVWVSRTDIDPFAVGDAEVTDLLAERSAALMDGRRCHRVDASFHAARDLTFYADSLGSTTLQQRTRVSSDINAFHVSGSDFDDMSTCAPPSARGWEYIASDDTWPWSREMEQLPDLLVAKVRAPSVQPGRYDLLIDPTNLWLTIHESVGHATELDRALGYEANYAGTSFVGADDVGRLRYGSALMNIRADRTADHGLATTAFDHEGVAAQSWDLVRGGVLSGFQLDRRMAAERGFDRSNGCAFAESASHIPVQRMPNVNLLPDPDGPGVDDLISGITDGIYVVGDKSWSIDMQRFNFQFTGQRFFRIRAGRLAGQVRDVAYQSSTPTFWAGLAAMGGPQTYLLGGALNCGKAQPGQAAPVSHGCPAAVFQGVNVLNSKQELE